MNWIKDKELRSYVGSIVYISITIGVIVVSFYLEIPPGNKDMVGPLIGVLGATLTYPLYVLIGKNNDEVDKLKRENKRAIDSMQREAILNDLTQSNERLIEQNTQLKKRVNQLEKMFMDLQEKIIDKLSNLSKDSDINNITAKIK